MVSVGSGEELRAVRYKQNEMAAPARTLWSSLLSSFVGMKTGFNVLVSSKSL